MSTYVFFSIDQKQFDARNSFDPNDPLGLNTVGSNPNKVSLPTVVFPARCIFCSQPGEGFQTLTVKGKKIMGTDVTFSESVKTTTTKYLTFEASYQIPYCRTHLMQVESYKKIFSKIMYSSWAVGIILIAFIYFAFNIRVSIGLLAIPVGGTILGIVLYIVTMMLFDAIRRKRGEISDDIPVTAEIIEDARKLRFEFWNDDYVYEFRRINKNTFS